MRYLLIAVVMFSLTQTCQAAPCPNGQCTTQVQGEYHPITRIARRGYRRVGRVWYGLFSPIHLNDGAK